MSAAVVPAVCPGCNLPVSEMERLTGKCAKDNLPLDQPREERYVFPALTPETVEVGMGVTYGVGSDRVAGTVWKVSASGKTVEFTHDHSYVVEGSAFDGSAKWQYESREPYRTEEFPGFPQTNVRVARWNAKRQVFVVQGMGRNLFAGRHEYRDPSF